MKDYFSRRSRIMLTVDTVYKSFGSHAVLRGVSFTLEKGTLAGLIGPSGGGKSVLLKIIAGIDRGENGNVHYNSGNAEDRALMFQEGALFDSLSVFDNVAFPLVHGVLPIQSMEKENRDLVAEKVVSILTRVGLREAIHKFPGQLSGGMRRRASLARALVTRPSLLLLDDPTAGLDPISSGVIMDLIREMHDDYGPTTIIASHDLRRLIPLAETLIPLFHGQVGRRGTLDTFLGEDSPEIRHFISCRYDIQSYSSEHHR